MKLSRAIQTTIINILWKMTVKYIYVNWSCSYVLFEVTDADIVDELETSIHLSANLNVFGNQTLNLSIRSVMDSEL